MEGPVHVIEKCVNTCKVRIVKIAVRTLGIRGGGAKHREDGKLNLKGGMKGVRRNDRCDG